MLPHLICFNNPHLLQQKSKFCEGTSFKAVEDNKVRHDYQEIKIQESTQVLDVGAIPRSIPIILMDDLVDIVKAGGTTFLHAYLALVFEYFFNFFLTKASSCYTLQMMPLLLEF